MGVVRKNMKYLKNQEKSLNFFSSYLDISKIRLLQLLNEKQDALNKIKAIKSTNALFLEKIDKSMYKHDNLIFDEEEFEDISSSSIYSNKNKEHLYILVDSKENDEVRKAIYKKLEETLAKNVQPNDMIITVGNQVNLIAQRMELNIVQHYPFELYQDQSSFIQEISNLIVIGKKNNIFTDVTLLIAQYDKSNQTLISKKLLPFNKKEVLEGEELSKTIISDFNEMGRASISENQGIASTSGYINFFDQLSVKEVAWIPSIAVFRMKLVELIIKENIYETKLKEEVQSLLMEIQMLDEKRNKLIEEMVIVKRWLNRIRREKETNSIIVLHSAFKLKNASNSDFDDTIRKKKKQDDFGTYSKRPRGGR